MNPLNTHLPNPIRSFFTRTTYSLDKVSLKHIIGVLVHPHTWWLVFLSPIILISCRPSATTPLPSTRIPILSPTTLPATITAVLPTFTPTAVSTSTLTPTSTTTTQPTATANPLVALMPMPDSGSSSLHAENKKPGTSSWFIAGNEAFAGDIAGFADATSVNVGETIRFAISTRIDKTVFTLAIYRLGWYGGAGGRLMLKADNLPGHAQGYWSPSTVGVMDCPTCTRDNDLGLLDAHWQYGYSLAVPKNWISGEYEVLLTTLDGSRGIIYFVVRQDQRASDLLVQFPINTEQAYNHWGGDSLYTHDPKLPPGINGGTAAVKVSFNRPYARYSISADVQVIHFIEKNGYDATYVTSVDIDRDPSILKGHRAFISVGHDEYWTRAMRQNVEAARDAGLNLAFLGGNDVYWQTRLEADSDGNAQRVMVMYRDAALDPYTKTDPSNVTVRFIDPPVNWPQNSLTGTIFGGISENPPGFPWIVAATAPAWMLTGTGLTPGSSVPALAGKECDSVVDNGLQPTGLVIVAASPFTTKEGNHIFCHSTYYQTSSGSAVFNAGTLSWPASLDFFGHHNPGQNDDSRIVQLVINILASFGAGKNQ